MQSFKRKSSDAKIKDTWYRLINKANNSYKRTRQGAFGSLTLAEKQRQTSTSTTVNNIDRNASIYIVPQH